MAGRARPGDGCGYFGDTKRPDGAYLPEETGETMLRRAAAAAHNDAQSQRAAMSRDSIFATPAHHLPHAVAALFLLAAAGCATMEGERSSSEAAAARDRAAIDALVDRIEQSFEDGDLDAAMAIFADDAMIIAQGTPDVIGADAIRAVYEEMLAATDLSVELRTDEVEVFGDLAYERGTYTVELKDKSSGDVLQVIDNRHVHIFRRGADGAWRTWRMIVNSVETP